MAGAFSSASVKLGVRKVLDLLHVLRTDLDIKVFDIHAEELLKAVLNVQRRPDTDWLSYFVDLGLGGNHGKWHAQRLMASQPPRSHFCRNHERLPGPFWDGHEGPGDGRYVWRGGDREVFLVAGIVVGWDAIAAVSRDLACTPLCACDARWPWS